MGNDLRIQLEGQEVPVLVRRHARAKRLTLRVDKTSGAIKLTLPLFVRTSAAERFLEKHSDWITRERAAVSPASAVSHGDEMPYLGTLRHIVFTDVSPRTVTLDTNQITVGGPAEMAGRRLENWMRLQAKDLLAQRAAHHAKILGVSYKNISIGDTKSRWGSCSSTGGLRFSWRLLMAPYEVLDYVAAHEVAHLREMNHSDRFWAAVSETLPDYVPRRRWLKTKGNELFKITF